MRNSIRHGGSVTLLVVGVLTALALIGSAFLMITWADKKEATALTQAAPIRPIVDNVVARIQQSLADGLYINNTGGGPYSSIGALNTADRLRAYVTYADPDPESYPAGANRLWTNLYLASSEPSLANGVQRNVPWAPGQTSSLSMTPPTPSTGPS